MAHERKPTGGQRPTVTLVPMRSSARGPASSARFSKPTVAGLGVDIAALDWQRSGTGPGSFEVAFVASRTNGQEEASGPSGASGASGRSGTAASSCDAAHGPTAEWVLLRVADDPAARVLVYDRNEWLCFLDGVVHGEFDRREGLARRMVP
jgi:hypothetical protein